MKFLDQAKVYLRSGNGGPGALSFRREKFIEFGGPNGGDGGRGGSVIVECVEGLNTLIDYRYQQHFKAKSGGHGMGRDRTGAAADDIILKVPVGTQIFEEDNETLIADLTEVGQQVVLCTGGDGGRGNAAFKTSTNRAPRKVEPGWPGEERWVWLRLKLIADVGLVGLPNAGKSTFLSVTSRAKPKIADYPFTTLVPQLGVAAAGDREFVIADIPGLIEGAADGVGLGIQFLKHLQRTRLLLHIIDVLPEESADSPVESARKILLELKRYDESLYQKPRWLVLNKTDLLPEEEVEAICAEIIAGLDWRGPVYNISAIKGEGVEPLCQDIMSLLESDESL